MDTETSLFISTLHCFYPSFSSSCYFRFYFCSDPSCSTSIFESFSTTQLLLVLPPRNPNLLRRDSSSLDLGWKQQENFYSLPFSSSISIFSLISCTAAVRLFEDPCAAITTINSTASNRWQPNRNRNRNRTLRRQSVDVIYLLGVPILCKI